MQSAATRSASPRPAATRYQVALGLVLLLAAALRLSVIPFGLAFVNIPLVNDEGAYWGQAQAILSGSLPANDLLFAYMRTPGYAAILAASIALFGPVVWPIALLQALLGVLTVGLTAWLTRHYVGSRAAVWAALLVAIQPALILFTQYLFIETIYACAIVAVLACLTQAHATAGRRWPWLIAAGLTIGAGALIRPQLLTLALPMLLWWFVVRWRATHAWRQPLAAIGLVGLMIAAFVLPWSARNYAVHGLFTFDTSGTLNLGMDNNTVGYREAQSRIIAAGESIRARRDEASRLWRDFVANHPDRFVRKALINAALTWRPERPDPFELREKRPGLHDLVLVLYADGKTLWLSVVGLLAIWGVLLFPRDRPDRRAFHLLLVTLLLIQTFTVAITHHEYRFAYPWFPLLALLATAGVAGLRQRRRPLLRRAAILLSLLYLAGNVWPSARLIGPQIAAWNAMRAGDAAAARGDLRDAEAAYTRAQRYQTGWSWPSIALGRLYESQDPERARRFYERAYEIRPDDVRAYIALSRLADQHGLAAPAEPELPVLIVALRDTWNLPPPDEQLIDVGGDDLGAIANFYGVEPTEGDTTVRWSGSTARLRAGGLPPDTPLLLRVRLRTITAVPDDRVLQIRSRGAIVAQFDPDPHWRVYSALLPPAGDSGIAEVVFDMPQMILSTVLPTSDPRDLGVQVDWFAIVPAAPSSSPEDAQPPNYGAQEFETSDGK